MWCFLLQGKIRLITFIYFLGDRGRFCIMSLTCQWLVGWLVGQAVSHIVSVKEPLRKYFDKLHQKEICVHVGKMINFMINFISE